MKRALVLAGGTAKGAYQVGMLKGLVEQDRELDFDIIRGVSVGALNGAFLAQYESGAKHFQVAVQNLESIWNSIEGNDSVYLRRPGIISPSPTMESVNVLDPLRKLVQERLNIERLSKSTKDFRVGTVSLVSGEYLEWGHGADNFVDKLVASTAIPVIFPIVYTKDRSGDTVKQDVLVDGGVRNITPLASAFRSKPDEIYVLLTGQVFTDKRGSPSSTVQQREYREWQPRKINWQDVLMRTIDILTNEIFLDDIRTAIRWNDVARELAKLKGKIDANYVGAIESAIGMKYDVKLNILAPKEFYGSDNDSMSFDPIRISHAIEHGRKVAADRTCWIRSA